MKYYKCNKCGNPIKITYPENYSLDTHFTVPCMQEAPYRTSGLCGGRYTDEITEEEFKKASK